MAKKRRRNVARDKILDQLIGRALLTSEAVRKEFMERLVDAIVDVGWHDEQGIIAVVRTYLATYEPLLAEHLSNAMILTWLGGYIEQTKHLPTVVQRWMRDHAYWAQQPPEIPGIFGPGDKSPPAVRFPRIEKAAESLFSRGLMTRPQYDRLSAAAKQATFTVAWIDDTAVIGEIRDALAEAIAEGPTLPVFRKKVVEKLEKSPMSAWHSETVYRTNLMSAYRDGKESLLQHPIVQEVFPFRQYFATHDGRVRDEHLALETLGIQGTGIYYNEDPVWDHFSVPWDYNCRCVTVPMRIADAARAGIEEAKEWLKTGVKPASPTYCLSKIPFRPKEGFGVRHGPLLSVGTASSVRMSAQPIRMGDANPWAPYKGPRGGTGWQHSGTGDVRYVKDRPGANETGASDASKPQTVAAEHAAVGSVRTGDEYEALPSGFVDRWSGDWKDAGFIATDGTLLGRQGRHRDMLNELGANSRPGREGNTGKVAAKHGLIRVATFGHPRIPGTALVNIQVWSIPTEAQLEEIVDKANSYGKLSVDVTDHKGKTRAYNTWEDRMPTASALKQFIAGALVQKKKRTPSAPPPAGQHGTETPESRESPLSPDEETTYSRGQCHALTAAILSVIPSAEPWGLFDTRYDDEIKHSVTRLPHTETFIDATGAVQGKAGLESLKRNFLDAEHSEWRPIDEYKVRSMVTGNKAATIRKALPAAKKIIRHAEAQ